MFSASLITKSPEKTRELAFHIAHYARPGDVYCLEGTLGAGKTVFAQGFAHGLGITEPVRSPSFPIIQEYRHNPPLYHIDFYRLSGIEDVIEIGADELFLGQGISLIEWPDRAASLLPDNAIRIDITIDDAGNRVIRIHADEERIKEFDNAQ